ncbi:30S ribosomal protein S16 [Corynebacterium flavescens]|uniref:Small ribosomal subunit protein bS16 n=1 Tax=Corynebacterium flavescens TaxID=28028 RepID=A0A1L7CMR5_CORFL|nr:MULTISPECIES: 30S ribosomal protein S16 [Corynebacterium]APT87108.1 30S ribosomal protein S16 [Corynebacterium flavescens]KAA8721350.1 30S ribosomal protein S16 [Corynebacterium flavescens]MDN6100044.1 30S ribosomal protein S16 [Corynebacterium flavescens]MDN6200159.1 30S ribosomal protein S16 [Corynebacterium flavescens]MDN6226654.1 30S ribosomal protein S16 [Corynebacterium flavescens]
MAVKIKLQRIGKIRNAEYRVIIADARTRRSGKAIENIGIYQPKQEPSLIQIDSERAQYWLSVGAQPTEPVLALLKVTGDWQKAKGLPGAEGTLKVAAEKPSKLDLFNAALAEANNGPTIEAITEKKNKAKEAAEAKAAAEKEAAEKAAAEAAAAEAEATEAPEAAEESAE